MAINPPAAPTPEAVPTPVPAVMDPKTQADASSLMRLLTGMFGTGPDGIEQGFGTSEFWLVVVTLAADFAGPHFGVIRSLSPDFQVALAGMVASAYVAFRSWRKRAAK